VVATCDDIKSYHPSVPEDARSLGELRADFLESSTVSMPIAGMLFWIAATVASRFLDPKALAYFVGFGSGTVFPLGLIFDRLRGRTKLADNRSPITQLFLQSLAMVALMWPLVILAGSVSPGLVVLGGNILMGLVWIPYGWAANDPVGLRHTLFRTIASYVMFVFVPAPFRLTMVCAVPVAAYFYSFMAMRKPQL